MHKCYNTKTSNVRLKQEHMHVAMTRFIAACVQLALLLHSTPTCADTGAWFPGPLATRTGGVFPFIHVHKYSTCTCGHGGHHTTCTGGRFPCSTSAYISWCTYGSLHCMVAVAVVVGWGIVGNKQLRKRKNRAQGLEYYNPWPLVQVCEATVLSLC